MRRRLRSNNLIKLAMIGVVAMAGGFLITSLCGSKSSTQALSATEFQPGRIIDDSIFYNPNTMTAAEIDAFIDSHSPTCDMWGTQMVYGNVTRAEYVKQLRAQGNSKYHDPPFVCVSEYYENPETHKTNFSTNGKKEEGMLSAGEIIYEAAHEYNINPQVLLVMLKKESYVWGDDWPHDFQYNTVMGYACPDGAPCDSKYFGFYNQVMMAAWQLNYYRDHIYSYNYRPYATNNILYNPDRSCGSKAVYLENIATTSLYIYTPYVPNDGALANYPGTSWCGSYGNRNFYMYFREWFGSTLDSPKEEAYFPDGDYFIASAQNPNEVLQPENGSAENGAKYTLGQNVNNASLFRLTRQNDGNYTFTNTTNSLALDVYGGVLTAGSAVSQWEAHNGTSQRFKIIDNKNGTYSLSIFNNPNVVISYNSKDKSASLDWFTNGTNQAFRLISARASSLEGIHRIVSASNHNFAADVYGGAIRRDGANINTWEQNPSDGQSFSFVYDPATHYYRIQPSYSTEFSIDVNGGGNNSNTNIGLWSNNDSCAQKWEPRFYEESNAISLINGCSGLAFDLHGGVASNGSNISTWTYEGNIAQRWLLLNPTSKQSNDSYSGSFEISANTEKVYYLSNPISYIEVSQDPVSKLYSIGLNGNDKYLAVTPSGIPNLISTEKSTYYANLWIVTGNFDSITIRNASNDLYLAINDNGILELNDSPSQNTTFEFKKAASSDYGYTGDGYYIIQSALNENYYLGILNDTGQKGDNISLTPKDKALKAYISKIANDTYIIEDKSRTRRLDVEGGISYNGANIGAWDNNGNHCNQRWIISQLGHNTSKLFESCNRRALEVYGGIAFSGANIGVWDSHTGLNQSWIIRRTDP